MFGFSLSELFLIILVILIFVRPKDLPEVAYFCGKLFYKAKNLFRNLKKSFNNLLKDSGLEDIKSEIDRGISDEKLKSDGKEPTIIVDMDGNEHKVYDINQIRSDLDGDDLESQIQKANKVNTKKPKKASAKKSTKKPSSNQKQSQK